MTRRLLDLPPELLSKTLSLLPTQSLLKFSSTSHYARSLANSNLHKISLGIHPIRTPSKRESNTTTDFLIRIPAARTYDYATLITFHNTLFQSILARHAETLYTVEISLWTLTRPIAEGIAKLFALRHLSIRIENHFYARAVPRSRVAVERREQSKAWTLLGKKAVWKERLSSLKIENSDLDTEQLVELLRGCRRCKELRIVGCNFVGQELWQVLGRRWEGRDGLRRLSVAECAGCLDARALGAVGGMSGLKVCKALTKHLLSTGY